LGGVCILLYGMIGMLGVRIWVENRVDFSKPLNIIVGAVPLVIGIADFTFTFGGTVAADGSIAGGVTVGGIAWGAIAALVLYHLVHALQKARGIDTGDTPIDEASKPDTLPPDAPQPVEAPAFAVSVDE
jgi:NCS2 family nucleobase:cation symporter-2